MKKTLLTPTFLYDEAKRRLHELEGVRAALEKKMPSYPPGKIHIVRSPRRIQFYLRKDAKDKSGQYIRKNNYKQIHTFLQKKYDEEIYKLITQEINGLDNLLSKSDVIKSSIQKSYSDYPEEIKAYIIPIDISDDDFINNWLSEPYEKKPIEDLPNSQRSDKGDIVRSKSELNIANMLYKKNIPYKYECPLKLSKGYVIHPDFTVLDATHRRVIYWEHRGMMDDMEYAQKAVQRLKDMGDDGLILGDNLIITEETKYSQLGTDEIERIIRHYFE